MRWPTLPAVVPWALALVLLVVVLGRCHQGGGPAVAPAVVARVDTILAESPRVQHVADSLAAVVAEHEDRSARAEARARRAEATTARMQGVADSFAVEARSEALSVAEAGERWRLAYDARTTEAGLLHGQVADLTLALSEQRTATLAAVSRGDTLDARVGDLTGLLAGLRADLARAERPCRIVWKVPCPSRTQAAVAGVVAGVLTGVAADR